MLTMKTSYISHVLLLELKCVSRDWSACKGASLSVLKRLLPHIAYENTRKTLVQSFVLFHFNYPPPVWYFTTARQLQKIEKIQERAFRFIADDYETSYEMFMANTETITMGVKHMQILC